MGMNIIMKMNKWEWINIGLNEYIGMNTLEWVYVIEFVEMNIVLDR